MSRAEDAAGAEPRAWLRLLGLVLAAALLTLLTQVGGVVLLATWLGLRGRSRRLRLGVFLFAYAVATALLLPISAALAGRVPLPCRASEELPLQSASLAFCAANRHYVRPELRARLEALARHLRERFPGTVLQTLDAGFPFGGPLLPHLGHSDGRQVDLALFHGDGAQLRSPLGYFAFEAPRPGDPQPCRGRAGTWRWDLAWLQPAFAGLPLDEARTAAALRWLVRDSAVGKVLVEPHLARRLGVAGTRFQGCRAARHDDHVHVQMRR